MRLIDGLLGYLARRGGRGPAGGALRLCTPGMSELSPRVRRAMSRPAVDPRRPEFSASYRRVEAILRRALQTTGDVVLLPGNGSLAMEVGLTNVVSPGETAVVVESGAFGSRFAAIGRAFGIDVRSLDVPWGEPADPEAVAAVVAAIPSARALCVVVVESSTGVWHDLGAIARAVRARRPDVLLLVDAISSLGAHELRADAWGLDVVCGAANKALGGPPGWAFVSVSPRAWEAAARSTTPRYNTSLPAIRACHRRGQTLYTPAVHALFGLEAALDEIEERGLLAYREHHRALALRARRLVQEVGLQLVVPVEYAAHTVTTVWMPEGIDARAAVAQVREEHGIVLSTGRGPWEQRVVRLGHLGYCSRRTVERAVRGLAQVMRDAAAPAGVPRWTRRTA